MSKFKLPFEDDFEYEKFLSENPNFDSSILGRKFYDSNSIRRYLHDFGYKFKTNEMKRDFYLKERLSQEERKNLVDLMNILSKSQRKNKLYFTTGVLAVGSSTYSDEYYTALEKSLIEQGITREDFIEERAHSYTPQVSDFKNYDDYLKEINESAFDDVHFPLVSQEQFDYLKNNEQLPYQKQKKVGDLLDDKGEDLDFVVFSDSYYNQESSDFF